MLLGEGLGGGHQGGLAAVLHRPQHRAQSHHRLARAHLAHQQALHRPVAGQVGVDLGHGPHLIAGQLEGKRPAPAVHRHPPGGQRPGPSLLPPGPPAPGHGQLEQQELLEGQPPASRRLVLRAVGKVRGRKRRRPVGQALGRPQAGGQRLHGVEHPPVGVPDQAPQPGGADALGGRVHGHEADRVHRRVAVAEQLVLAHPELARAAELAVQEHLRPLPQLAGDPGLVEPDGHQRPALVEDPCLDPPPPAVAHRPDGHPPHAHRHRGLLPDTEVGGEAHVAPVAVRVGQVLDQVAGGGDAERRQRLGRLALQDQRLGQPAGPRVAHRGGQRRLGRELLPRSEHRQHRQGMILAPAASIAGWVLPRSSLLGAEEPPPGGLTPPVQLELHAVRQPRPGAPRG